MPQIARADTVGSLLRPRYLLDARTAVRAGTGSMADLHAAEERAVLEDIAIQERAGIDVITDGEARRPSWIASASILGVDAGYVTPLAGFGEVEGPGWLRGWRDAQGNPVQLNAAFRRKRSVVVEPLRVQRGIVADEYAFLKAHTTRRTKYTFPAPSYHRVLYDPVASKAAYPTVDHFLAAVRDYMREHIVRPLIDLGCDYIQLDAPNYGQFYVDPEIRASYEAEGHDLTANLIADAEIDNSLFEGVSGVTRAIHVCRGNGPGGIWSAAGGYEPIAIEMFPRLPTIDALLLEYDTPRSGDFGPLRHVLPHATVVLGLITTKAGALESAVEIEARIREATQYVPLDRLSLSPQCGFASAEAGNPLSMAEQDAKLARVVEVARKVWS